MLLLSLLLLSATVVRASLSSSYSHARGWFVRPKSLGESTDRWVRFELRRIVRVGRLLRPCFCWRGAWRNHDDMFTLVVVVVVVAFSCIGSTLPTDALHSPIIPIYP